MTHQKLNPSKADLKRIQSHLAYLNTESLFGWVLLAFGLPFFVIAISSFSYESFITNWDTAKSVNGVISNVEESALGENGFSIYTNEYEYEIETTVFRGIGYSRGNRFNQGDTVTVMYQEDNHQISRIKGMRKSPWGLASLLTILFPLLGIYFLYKGIAWGKDKSKAVLNGVMTKSRVSKSVKTNTQTNEDALFKHYIEFEDLNRKRHECSYFSVFTPKDEVELIYNEDDPSKTLVLQSQNVAFEGRVRKMCGIKK